MKVANDAFLDKAGFQISPAGPFIVLEHKKFDAMSRQIIEADLQDGSQEARSDTAPGVSHGNALEQKALVGTSDTLQNCESGNVCSVSCQQVSGRRVLDFSGVLLRVPSAD